MKAILIDTSWALVTVWYPYRRSPDVYVATGKPFIRCLQCESDVQLTDLADHLRGHDRRVGPAPIVSPIKEDGKIKWRIVEGFSHRPPDSESEGGTIANVD